MSDLLLILLFSLFTIAPLLQPGYQWDAHDARHSVYFLFEFDRGIQDGNLYPRWQPDFAFGYGYPFFNIYGPLSTYVGEAFHLLGLGFTDAVKAVFALSVVCSGLAMYGFVRQVLGQQAGLVAAVAYMVIPYRLVDLYVRAALAESVAYVFAPLMLWGVWAAIHRPHLANILGLAFAYAALMFTSPLVTLLLTLILVFYIAALSLARVNDEQPFRQLSRESLPPLLGHLGHVLIPVGVGLVLGVGLSALFALPTMTENRFVRLDQWYGGRYAWGGDFVEFFQLFSPQWGFGASVPGPNDDVSFQLGVAPVVLSLFAVASLVIRRRSPPHPPTCGRRPPPQGRGGQTLPPSEGEGRGEGGNRRQAAISPPPTDLRSAPSPPGGRGPGGGWDFTHPTASRLVAFFALLTAIVVFLMLGVSAPLWQVLPLARLAQFPWRLLTLTVVSMAFLCGAAAAGGWGTGRLGNWVRAPTLALAALLVLGSLPYMQAEMSEGEASLAGLMRFQQSADEMTGSTAWARRIPTWSPLADYHIAGEPLTSRVDFESLYRQAGKVHARTLDLRTDRELVEYAAERSALLTFNIFYYPGWRAYLLDAGTNAVIEELPIALRSDLGLMTVRLPAGVGRVLLRFEDTPIRKLGTAVTVGSLTLVVLLLLGRWVLHKTGPIPKTGERKSP